MLGCIGSNDLNKQRRGKAHDHAQITRDRNELEKEARRRFPLMKATGIRTQFCGLEFIFYPEEVEVLIFDKNFFCHIFFWLSTLKGTGITLMMVNLDFNTLNDIKIITEVVRYARLGHFASF